MPFFLINLFFNVKKLMPLLIKNYKIVIFVLMAAVIGYQNFFETRVFFGSETIPSLKIRLAAAENAVLICKDGNDKLSAAIDERNAEVEKWAGLTEVLEGDILVLKDKINNMRVDTVKAVDSILKDETPKTCEASIDYLRDGRKDLQW